VNVVSYDFVTRAIVVIEPVVVNVHELVVLKLVVTSCVVVVLTNSVVRTSSAARRRTIPELTVTESVV
jgi:hypothetical protein